MHKTIPSFAFRALFWIIPIFFYSVESLAQKPGKEEIVLNLPKEVKWIKKKHKKDKTSIRGFSWDPKITQDANQKFSGTRVEILTIDKRFYPLSAKENVEEKWRFRQSQCRDSSLDIVYQNKDDAGLIIVFILRNASNRHVTQDTNELEPCDLPAWILLASEGPTAFHAVEVQVPESKLTPELTKIWVEILKNRILK